MIEPASRDVNVMLPTLEAPTVLVYVSQPRARHWIWDMVYYPEYLAVTRRENALPAASTLSTSHVGIMNDLK